MRVTFKLNPSIKIIFVFVLLFGLILSVLQSDFILHLNNQSGPAIEMRQQELVLSSAQLASLSKEKILILTDEQNEDSMALARNISKTLEYMKKEFEVFPYQDVPSDLEKYDSIILTFEGIEKIRSFDTLINYVGDGGSMVFATRPEISDHLYQYYRKLGINEIGDFITTEGVKVNSSILFGAKNKKFAGDFFVNSSLSLSLDPNVRVELESIEGVPLLWRNSYEKGRFVVFNGSVLGSKENRGIIAGALSLTKENYLYPVMNAKVAFIDDFPAPFPEGFNPLISEEFQLDTASFYQKVWWPDIQKGAAKYNLIYSAAMIQTYEDNVQPPFGSKLLHSGDRITRYGRDLLKMGGEIGFHGYNHQSLTLDEQDVKELGYNEWDSITNMEDSLKELSDFSQELFPKYIQKMYVPPSNIVSEAGLEAIMNALPNVNVIASLYMEDPDQAIFSQEFAVDKDFIHLPRVTFGYVNEAESYWAMVNAVNSVGVFSHFIHPDDILDPDRRFNKSYAEMKKSYNSFLEYVHKNYSWLKPMIASQAADNVAAYWRTDSFIKEDGNKITLYNNRVSGDLTFILRSEAGIDSVKNGYFTQIDDHVYAITTKSSKVQIVLERKR